MEAVWKRVPRSGIISNEDMSQNSKIEIDRRFRGPASSGNGGYVCGRLANFIPGTATVRLRVPPPLEVEMDVRPTSTGMALFHGEKLIAEAWPSVLDIEIPPAPAAQDAERASRLFAGFQFHRFPTCFVCGPQRAPDEGLRIFAGPVAGRQIVSCTWTPDAGLSPDGHTISPEFVWAALDCPGGFAFPHPEHGTILLGELTVQRFEPVIAGRRHVVIGWQILQDRRKHHTGTALFSESGNCLAAGRGIWLEVEGIPE
jgi:hypothetical protein